MRDLQLMLARQEIALLSGDDKPFKKLARQLLMAAIKLQIKNEQQKSQSNTPTSE